MNHEKFSTRILIQAAMMAAITIVLAQFHLFQLPQGGEISLGTMVPLILLARAHGVTITLLAGFICGMIGLMLNPFIYHPVQVLLDYPLPYMVMAIAALFRQHLYLGVTAAFTLKFLCHFLSGVIFFAAYAPEGMSPILYSATYNATTLVPDFIICCLILKLLPLHRLSTALHAAHHP